MEIRRQELKLTDGSIVNDINISNHEIVTHDLFFNCIDKAHAEAFIGEFLTLIEKHTVEHLKVCDPIELD